MTRYALIYKGQVDNATIVTADDIEQMDAPRRSAVSTYNEHNARLRADAIARAAEALATESDLPVPEISDDLAFESVGWQGVIAMRFGSAKGWEEVPDDVHVHIGMVKEDDGTFSQLVIREAPPTLMARNLRDAKLRESDWSALTDAPLTPEQRQQWAYYRQALRDVPRQPGFPVNFDWPQMPRK